MSEWITEIDRSWFVMINSQMGNPIFDLVMPWMRNKFFWIPLYGVVVAFLWKNKRKYFFHVTLALVLSIIISDQFSSAVLKPLFERERPCHPEQIIEPLNLLVHCGSGFSFPSSHATNHFALGILFGLIFLGEKRWILPVGILWAALISYAQVYVGVHFPMDVFAGGLLGTFIALVMFTIFRKFAQ